MSVVKRVTAGTLLPVSDSEANTTTIRYVHKHDSLGNMRTYTDSEASLPLKSMLSDPIDRP